MAATGGSVPSVTINKRIFEVTADADLMIDPGGESVEFVPTGSGKTIKKITKRPWKVSGCTLVIDHQRGDMRFLQQQMALTENGGVVECLVELADGTRYRGKGGPSGDALEASTQNATCEIELSGPGLLEIQ